VETDLKQTEIQAKSEIKSAKTSADLDLVSKKYLGSNGVLRLSFKGLAKLPEAQRRKQGAFLNKVQKEIMGFIQEKSETLGKQKTVFSKDDRFDLNQPGERIVIGHLHLLTQLRREVEEIFQSMGFSVALGPEVETEWYNFDALNIPKDHPARDIWDTFWLKNLKLLLRTHTSPVQVRYMENNQPPLRVIVPGSVFRHEATDASHEFQLFQIEGLMVDRNVSVANLRAIIAAFYQRLFNKSVKTRLRPDFFPFTEPSFDLAINCLVCQGRGCQVCKNTGWVEMAGAGMVHPKVFQSAGLDPKKWQGWAFGFGLDRLAMMKYKIDDIRLFRSGDLRFLNQF